MLEETEINIYIFTKDDKQRNATNSFHNMVNDTVTFHFNFFLILRGKGKKKNKI